MSLPFFFAGGAVAPPLVWLSHEDLANERL
jgi:hypothetical protein